MHVYINQASGLAGIAYWVNDFYQLPASKKIDKQDSLIVEMKKMIDLEYASGRTSIMGDDELDNMVRNIDKKRHKLMYIHMQ